MKVYKGVETGTVVGPKVVLVNGKQLKQPNKHSPSGFNWGYGGSGPADLAYAILFDLYGEEVADLLYQQFKWDFIAVLPQGEGWTITESEITNWKKEATMDG